jgi:hypothetical protein
MPPSNPSSATASPAASSPPDLPEPGGLCSIHQPNLLPRLTTLAKLFAADYWIVLDDVQFARRDYQHRARLAALDDPMRCRWLTLPTHLPHGRPTIIENALTVDPAGSRHRAQALLRQQYGTSPHWPAFNKALQPVWEAFDTGRTAAVAAASTRVLLDLLGWQGHIISSRCLAARPGRSQRLADLAALTGAGAYLCGTGGMTYLDPLPFTDQGINVIPFQTPTAGLWQQARSLSAVHTLMQFGPAKLGAELRDIASRHRRGIPRQPDTAMSGSA